MGEAAEEIVEKWTVSSTDSSPASSPDGLLRRSSNSSRCTTPEIIQWHLHPISPDSLPEAPTIPSKRSIEGGGDKESHPGNKRVKPCSPPSHATHSRLLSPRTARARRYKGVQSRIPDAIRTYSQWLREWRRRNIARPPSPRTMAVSSLDTGECFKGTSAPARQTWVEGRDRDVHEDSLMGTADRNPGILAVPHVLPGSPLAGMKPSEPVSQCQSSIVTATWPPRGTDATTDIGSRIETVRSGDNLQPSYETKGGLQGLVERSPESAAFSQSLGECTAAFAAFSIWNVVIELREEVFREKEVSAALLVELKECTERLEQVKEVALRREDELEQVKGVVLQREDELKQMKEVALEREDELEKTKEVLSGREDELKHAKEAAVEEDVQDWQSLHQQDFFKNTELCLEVQRLEGVVAGMLRICGMGGLAHCGTCICDTRCDAETSSLDIEAASMAEPMVEEGSTNFLGMDVGGEVMGTSIAHQQGVEPHSVLPTHRGESDLEGAKSLMMLMAGTSAHEEDGDSVELYSPQTDAFYYQEEQAWPDVPGDDLEDFSTAPAHHEGSSALAPNQDVHASSWMDYSISPNLTLGSITGAPEPGPAAPVSLHLPTNNAFEGDDVPFTPTADSGPPPTAPPRKVKALPSRAMGRACPTTNQRMEAAPNFEQEIAQQVHGLQGLLPCVAWSPVEPEADWNQDEEFAGIQTQQIFILMTRPQPVDLEDGEEGPANARRRVHSEAGQPATMKGIAPSRYRYSSRGRRFSRWVVSEAESGTQGTWTRGTARDDIGTAHKLAGTTTRMLTAEEQSTRALSDTNIYHWSLAETRGGIPRGFHPIPWNFRLFRERIVSNGYGKPPSSGPDASRKVCPYTSDHESPAAPSTKDPQTKRPCLRRAAHARPLFY
ncbi:hypothetical protein FIBSPDRAFT_926925 [Athelia psychrophila]|uniref:Uncharacterized protein n=1 Tax=Athelia psychrophila TaxID=1759441 RepID=A0A166ST86_9AGAM|nr:hypothetical protein FIBSPDRAFT_926925 [Fibularhizoctonia sp. CBS 109695]